MAGLYVAQADTRRSDVGAGMLIGLGVAAKVTPVISWRSFLIKRRWLLALAGVVSVGLWLAVVPAIAFGWDQNLRWLAQWTGS